MRTLAPTEVWWGRGSRGWFADCNLCGGQVLWSVEWERAITAALMHLRSEHPWPWANAQLDTSGGGTK